MPLDFTRARLDRLELADLFREDLGWSPPPITAVTAKLDAAFDVEAVTRKFYQEIANWFFWARSCADVTLPKDVKTDEDRSLFFIRLLTRLIFCWFLRKKRHPQTHEGLLPDALFDEQGIRQLLKDPSPDACTYYPAILQNLFFATLNKEMDKPGEPPNRRFVDEGDGQRSDDHMVHHVWRNARLLRDPDAFAGLLRRVPFLNGGLFECLDDRLQKGKSTYTEEIRLDGFSNDPRKQPKLPNYLFFGPERVADLAEAYGDQNRRRETVRPLLSILSGYNFTLTENTPLEQEVALDPELLGHVFENLLASYNPETGVVARNATGSFYTPRVVVDWMVDQALIAYLETKVTQAFLSVDQTVDPKVTQTFLSANQTVNPDPAQGDVATNPDTDKNVCATLNITRRNLPHWTLQGAIYWITFRLADSLPREKLQAWRQERDAWVRLHPEPWDEATWREYDERFGSRLEEWLDAGHGSRALARPDVREAVRECLMRFDGDRLRIHAAVIMPTHVHVLLEPLGDHALSELMKGIKGASARAANKLLGTSGQFWMDESYDHIVRSESQYQHFLRYIRENPVKARLRGDEFWLYEGDTGIPACAPQSDTGIPACESEPTTDKNVCATLNPRLRQLLSWDDTRPDFTVAETEALIDAIDRLKALDPACGSGAFPMGLLQKLVHLLRKLDPENKGWRRRQEAALDSFASATAREEARRAIERAFARDNDDYGRKLYLIENCLYGVDIQPIACQIAKLRFFIALIVDQTIDPAQPNYGILPLPNLETKIVAANTLLGLQRGQLLLGSERVRELERQLQQVRHDYFTARRYKDKKALRARDRELCAELATALTDSGECTPLDAQRLAQWNPYDTNAAASFFDPAWMFGLTKVTQAFLPVTATHTQAQTRMSESPSDEGVFDLVLGNPPYVRQEQLKNVTVTGSDGRPRPLKDALKDQYECYTGTADLYVYFFERSLQLLRTGGVLSFITSNKYMRAAYGERLRTCLFYATHPRVILDFGDSPVFTAIAYPCIIVTEKVRSVPQGGLPSPQQFQIPERIRQLLDAPDRTVRVLAWKPGDALPDFPDIFDAQAQPLAQRDLKPDGWRLESPVKLRLLDRLRVGGTPLGDYVQGRFYYGIKTGLNEAFVVDRATRDRLIAEHPSSAEVLKPFLRGRDVKRWRCDFADQYLIRIESSENVQHPWSGKLEKEAERTFAKTFPAIHAWFDTMRDALIQRYDQGRYFWELRSCDYWREFEQPKVVYQEINRTDAFAYDPDGYYMNNKLFMLPGQTPFLLGILCSGPLRWFIRTASGAVEGGFLGMQWPFMKTLPIPTATAEQRRWCERLAEALIWLHQGDTGIPACAPQSDTGIPTCASKSDTPTDKNVCATQRDPQLRQFLEALLNGLVYALFFPAELHARALKFFDLLGRSRMPDLAAQPAARRLPELRGWFETACDIRSPLRAALHDLAALEIVRIIEERG